MLNFCATWVEPCALCNEAFSELSSEHEHLKFLQLDADDFPDLIERFVAHEFDRLDVDGSGYIELPEFTNYVTRMSPWMRVQLREVHNDSALFDNSAQRAVEGVAKTCVRAWGLGRVGAEGSRTRCSCR